MFEWFDEITMNICDLIEIGVEGTGPSNCELDGKTPGSFVLLGASFNVLFELWPFLSLLG